MQNFDATVLLPAMTPRLPLRESFGAPTGATSLVDYERRAQAAMQRGLTPCGSCGRGLPRGAFRMSGTATCSGCNQ